MQWCETGLCPANFQQAQKHAQKQGGFQALNQAVKQAAKQAAKQADRWLGEDAPKNQWT